MSDRNWYIGIAIGVVVLISAVLIVVLPKKSGGGSGRSGGGGNMPSGGGGGGNMPGGCGNCFMADADCAPVPDPNQQGAYVNSPNALGIQCAKYFVENGQYVPYDPRNPPNPALQSTFINSNLAGACDNLMVAKDGNCGSCYQQVYNAHLDKCNQAGDIRPNNPTNQCDSTIDYYTLGANSFKCTEEDRLHPQCENECLKQCEEGEFTCLPTGVAKHTPCVNACTNAFPSIPSNKK